MDHLYYHLNKVVYDKWLIVLNTIIKCKNRQEKFQFEKSLHDDHSDGSTSLTSSPPVKRIARMRKYNGK